MAGEMVLVGVTGTAGVTVGVTGTAGVTVGVTGTAGEIVPDGVTGTAGYTEGVDAGAVIDDVGVTVAWPCPTIITPNNAAPATATPAMPTKIALRRCRESWALLDVLPVGSEVSLLVVAIMVVDPCCPNLCEHH
ncbi:hypothetical protein [Gordonia sp. VNQ95]|uniref:hypothetical protein n=1 Tax=Gordonia sp. VNQ95 TaxID=3156619 RepID=UPI0032B3C6FC